MKTLRSYIFICLFSFSPVDALTQGPERKEVVTLSGFIEDAETKERLPGASIRYTTLLGSGTNSNQYGFFSLSRPKGQITQVEVSFVGYEPLVFQSGFKKDSIITLSLQRRTTILNEIIISSNAERGSLAHEGGKFSLSSDKIRSISSFGGEPDVMKSLQFLPGVQSGNEGTTNLAVRGGSYDQNLILLDEAPVYNASHALSFFSIFSIDAINSVDFYKSEIPAKYGGRLSSVIDVRMKEGNKQRSVTRGSMGIVSSKITTEGPISPDGRLSYLFSGRYSYAGQVVNGIYLLGSQFNDQTANESTTNNDIQFYDLNAKINYQVNQKNQLFVSTYAGSDQFYFDHITSGYNLKWGNRTLTLRWNHVFGKKLFSNTTYTGSQYKYQYQLLKSTEYFNWSAQLKEKQIKQDYDWYVNASNHVIFGFGVAQITLRPGEVRPRDSNAISIPYRMEERTPISFNEYIGASSQLTQLINLTYGLRVTTFGSHGKRTMFIFDDKNIDLPTDSVTTNRFDAKTRLEPRIAVQFTKGDSKISISYDRTVQFLHLLANSSVGLPTDIWWPSSDNIKSQFANIYAVNYRRALSRSFEVNFSPFYKSLRNIADFKDNAKLFVNKYVESQILQGKGTAYGIEWLLVKTTGRLSGTMSYTYSKTYNRIEGVNNGQQYPNRYDKRHNASIVLGHHVSKRLTLNSNFVLTSGGALTLPNGSFVFDGVAFNSYGPRNNYRLPTYHRLDISLRYENGEGNASRKIKKYWTFDVYNVYGKRNPFTIYSVQSDFGFYSTRTRALFLYRVVPTVSFNFEF